MWLTRTGVPNSRDRIVLWPGSNGATRFGSIINSINQYTTIRLSGEGAFDEFCFTSRRCPGGTRDVVRPLMLDATANFAPDSQGTNREGTRLRSVAATRFPA